MALGTQTFLLVLWALSGFSMIEANRTYRISGGGTTLLRWPHRYMIVITQTSDSAEERHPDCVGVYFSNYGLSGKSVVLTAPPCVAHSKSNGTSHGLQIVRNAADETTKVEPFKLEHVYTDGFRAAALRLLPPVNYGASGIPNNLINNKDEFRRHLDARKSNLTYGFVLSTTPMKIFVVSWNQENCAQKYKEMKLPSWPEEMIEGGFCVFSGKNPVSNLKVDEDVYNVDVGMPCDDAMGSPVLISDFSKVLGIIIKTHCEGTKSVAFAMAPACIADISIVTPGISTIESRTIEPTQPLPGPTLPSSQDSDPLPDPTSDRPIPIPNDPISNDPIPNDPISNDPISNDLTSQKPRTPAAADDTGSTNRISCRLPVWSFIAVFGILGVW